MSAPQLIGLSCVVCRKGIASILDGTFCECGNPVHQKCMGRAQEPTPERCPHCGGDPNDKIAAEVRRERGTAAQEEARQQAATRKPTHFADHTEAATAPGAYADAYPVGGVCPKCGGGEYTRERPKAWISFAWDRVCTSCGTRYSPPTPTWAAFVFIIAGLLLLGFGGGAILLGMSSASVAAGPSMLCEGFLAALGILAILQGLRSLNRPGKV